MDVALPTGSAKSVLLGGQEVKAQERKVRREKDVALTGKSLDTVTAGPLAAGAFALAVRPAGHDRWTYEGDTEDEELDLPARAPPTKMSRIVSPTMSMIVFVVFIDCLLDFARATPQDARLPASIRTFERRI